jgi:hypothetical protein
LIGPLSVVVAVEDDFCAFFVVIGASPGRPALPDHTVLSRVGTTLASPQRMSKRLRTTPDGRLLATGEVAGVTMVYMYDLLIFFGDEPKFAKIL